MVHSTVYKYLALPGKRLESTTRAFFAAVLERRTTQNDPGRCLSRLLHNRILYPPEDWVSFENKELTFRVGFGATSMWTSVGQCVVIAGKERRMPARAGESSFTSPTPVEKIDPVMFCSMGKRMAKWRENPTGRAKGGCVFFLLFFGASKFLGCQFRPGLANFGGNVVLFALFCHKRPREWTRASRQMTAMVLTGF
jgi:hypothetical protein